eukprot:jgi/Chlat1/2477/Chrsp175S02422
MERVSTSMSARGLSPPRTARRTHSVAWRFVRETPLDRWSWDDPRLIRALAQQATYAAAPAAPPWVEQDREVGANKQGDGDVDNEENDGDDNVKAIFRAAAELNVNVNGSRGRECDHDSEPETSTSMHKSPTRRSTTRTSGRASSTQRYNYSP